MEIYKMLKQTMILAMVIFLVGMALPFASAIFTQNEDMFISHSVRLPDGSPSASIVCNITVLNPDEVTVVSYDGMINNASTQKHEYTVTNINDTGEWCYDLTCSGTSQNGTESYCVDVTPNGEMPSTASGIFYLGIFAVLLLFLVLTIWGVMHFDNLIARFSLLQFLYLLVIGITFIAYMMASDFITSAPFIISIFKIFFWVVTIAFFPYVLSMMIWLGYSMITIKEIEQMMERGISMDEAHARRKGGKSRW